MWWLIVLVIAVLAYLYLKGQADLEKVQEEITSSFTAEIIPVSAGNKDQESLKELSQPVESSSRQNTQTAVFELIDFMTPRLKVGGNTMRVLEGNNRIVVWDSPRVNLLRKQFNVKNVMQRLEFREGDNTIEVYRALADDRVVTFVFPHENDDSDIIPLMIRSTSDDPSETSSRNKTKGVLDVTKTDTDNVPSDLIPLIRDLQSSYATRQSSSGPKAIDTHRS
jgi:hypothetical protein